jgi:hypothetical protein
MTLFSGKYFPTLDVNVSEECAVSSRIIFSPVV